VCCAALCCRARAQGVENKRCYELNEDEINKIRDEVGKHTTEADLVRRSRGQGRAGTGSSSSSSSSSTRIKGRARGDARST
jgi:hypothetical protein